MTQPVTAIRSIRQQGSALTIAIVLLLLLTLAIFVAVPSIMGEQRVSGNDVRAKIAQHVAEAGLSHGREFLRLNSGDLIMAAKTPVDFAKWAACAATDTMFPCGAIESDVANSSLRARHYRYIGGGGRTISFSPGRMYDGTGSDAGNFNASYDVGVLLCRLDATSECTSTVASTTNTSMFTLISRGIVTGEGTTATVSETIGTYRIVNLNTNIPPVMAAGTITGLGNSTIVGNPNAGGFGVPLSIWARNDFDGSGGSWQTCQLEEYLRSDLTGVVMQGKNKNVATCADCDCTIGDRLSGSNLPVEGIDILDSTDADLGKAKAGSSYFFPCDMFEYVLGVRARDDTNGDGVCETIKTDTGVPGVADVIEWLTANAQIQTCAQLGPNSAGIIWVQGPCTGGDALSNRIGSPDDPVVLVVDGSLKLNTNVEFFGVVFLRYTGSDFAACVGSGTGCPELEPGGGGARIYGSLVMEGGGKINGAVDIVYLPQLVQAFNESPSNNRFAGLPGSWSDRVAY